MKSRSNLQQAFARSLLAAAGLPGGATASPTGPAGSHPRLPRSRGRRSDRIPDIVLTSLPGPREVEAVAAELIDTMKPGVMREVLREGASMINDVNALRAPGAVEALAGSEAGICLMHMKGEPRTMQDAPHYEDVVGEVVAFVGGSTGVGIHTQNDSGCAVANSIAAVVGGATQVQGTVNGYGERTGNVDVVNLAINLFVNGVDPELDISDIDALRRVAETSLRGQGYGISQCWGSR